jgi:hypothetical protein
MNNEFTKKENGVESERPPVSIEKNSINEKITAIWIDNLLEFLRNGYFSDFFEKNEKWLTKCGLYGLYVSGLLGLIVSVVFPIRYDFSFVNSVGIGIAWFSLCIVTHYTAYKFLPNIANIIKSTPTKMSSEAFFDSLAVITGICGIISLCFGLFLWAKTSSFESFVIAFFIFIFCEYMLSLCLNPKILNIAITENASAGEEFIGLLSFFVKSFLKLIPILFGSGIIFGVITILESLFVKFEYLPEIIAKATQVGTLTAAALLPITGYLLFLMYYIMIDIAASVLVIPKKLDKINEIKASQLNS